MRKSENMPKIPKNVILWDFGLKYPLLNSESMYFIAIDNEKNLYIVDRFENILKKLDAKLEKLNIDDTNVDNCVTYANVSKENNTLVISTEYDFITYIVNLENLSTKLAEVNDN